MSKRSIGKGDLNEVSGQPYPEGMNLADSTNNHEQKNTNLSSKDRYSIAVLLFLYVLQGIPLGLAGAIPLLLQTKKVEYKDQATFSLVFWPFSVKLFWAPFVDAVYFPAFGRRKSWLVPVQYLIGFFMIFLSRVGDPLLRLQCVSH